MIWPPKQDDATCPAEIIELHLFYNLPTFGAVYALISQRLLPLDKDG
jgi:hypothetical protein